MARPHFKTFYSTHFDENRHYSTIDMIHVRYKTFFEFLNPFRTAVPLWGQTTQILSSLSPKRDCGSKGVNDTRLLLVHEQIHTLVVWGEEMRIYQVPRTYTFLSSTRIISLNSLWLISFVDNMFRECLMIFVKLMNNSLQL